MIEEFEKKIRETILRHRLLEEDGTVIVALSGGADSVALLAVLTALGYRCAAAHCNFHLRGGESDRDERHARAIAKKLGADIHVRHFDTEAYAEQMHVSEEMACRELRYRWFEHLRRTLGAQAVAVAHHCDDNIETMFLNLLRGTGIHGLAAIRHRNGFVARPLLDVTRAEIEEYLGLRDIAYVTDSTNLSNDFKRNRLRNVLLPKLYELFPEARRSIAKSISYLRENAVVYDHAVKTACGRYRHGDAIDLAALLAEYPAPATLLYEMLHPMGFSLSQVRSIVACADGSGQRFRSSSHAAVLSRGRLLLKELSCSDTVAREYPVSLREDIDVPVKLRVAVVPAVGFRPEKDGSVLYLDASVLEGSPRFALRRWRRGDRMIPYGMKGSKKLSDVFTDLKLSLLDKQNLWILTRDSRILWIVGLRASALYPVTDATERIVEVSLCRQ